MVQGTRPTRVLPHRPGRPFQRRVQLPPEGAGDRSGQCGGEDDAVERIEEGSGEERRSRRRERRRRERGSAAAERPSVRGGVFARLRRGERRRRRFRSRRERFFRRRSLGPSPSERRLRRRPRRLLRGIGERRRPLRLRRQYSRGGRGRTRRLPHRRRTDPIPMDATLHVVGGGTVGGSAHSPQGGHGVVGVVRRPRRTIRFGLRIGRRRRRQQGTLRARGERLRQVLRQGLLLFFLLLGIVLGVEEFDDGVRIQRPLFLLRGEKDIDGVRRRLYESLRGKLRRRLLRSVLGTIRELLRRLPLVPERTVRLQLVPHAQLNGRIPPLHGHTGGHRVRVSSLWYQPLPRSHDGQHGDR
mmetsp:Transcript_25990/g.76889  ORF Transcript_25990/g.76889 Transcript_25990/m.76889 type:complete len:356 (+) Transcript_25990:578-1645(+)